MVENYENSPLTDISREAAIQVAIAMNALCVLKDYLEAQKSGLVTDYLRTEVPIAMEESEQSIQQLSRLVCMLNDAQGAPRLT